MSTVIAYRRLFEVQILHEYYLLGPNILSYFDLPKTDRDAIFKNRVLWNQYHLRNDLQIEPEEKTQALLKGLKWRFLQTTAGFVVAASAVPFQLINGSPAFKPTIPPSAGTQLLFYIRTKNPFFQNFTALPLRRKIPQPIYYFNNSALSVDGTDFASLSAAVTPIQAGKPYEMGELALIGGVLKEALQNTDGNNTITHWRTLPGNGYVNESDRICLPKTFNYRFAASQNVQSITFTLEKPDGTPLPPLTITGDGVNPLEDVVVRFNPMPPDGFYQLKVDTGTTQTNTDVFLTDAYDPTALGIVHLNLDETDLTYRLLGAEGEIRTRIRPASRYHLFLKSAFAVGERFGGTFRISTTGA